MTDWKPGDKALWDEEAVTVETELNSYGTEVCVRDHHGNLSIIHPDALRPLPAPAQTRGCAVPWAWCDEYKCWQRGRLALTPKHEATCTRCGYALKDSHAEAPGYAYRDEEVARLTQGNKALRQHNQRLRNHRGQMERQIANLKQKLETKVEPPALEPLDEEAVLLMTQASYECAYLWTNRTMQDWLRYWVHALCSRFGVPPAPAGWDEEGLEKVLLRVRAAAYTGNCQHCAARIEDVDEVSCEDREDACPETGGGCKWLWAKDLLALLDAAPRRNRSLPPGSR